MLTKNLGYKLSAVLLAVMFWLIARFWMVR